MAYHYFKPLMAQTSQSGALICKWSDFAQKGSEISHSMRNNVFLIDVHDIGVFLCLANTNYMSKLLEHLP